jgi:hypothetical protein
VKLVILAEDKSDEDTLKCLVNQIHNEKHPGSLKKPTILTKSYGGLPHLLRKAARDIDELHRRGGKKFIICADADGDSSAARRKEVTKKVIKHINCNPSSCIVVPVEEIEAWILADIEKVTQIIPSWIPKPIVNPESISSPKEHIEKISRDPSTRRARYAYCRDNKRMAPLLSLSVVRAKCPSFQYLSAFV